MNFGGPSPTGVVWPRLVLYQCTRQAMVHALEPRDDVSAHLLLTRILCLSMAENPFTRSAMLTLVQRKSLVRGVVASTALGGSAVRASTSIPDGESVKSFIFQKPAKLSFFSSCIVIIENDYL